MENPKGDGDDTDVEANANVDDADLENLSDDDDRDANTDVWTRVVRQLNRNPPLRFAGLPENERIDHLNQLVTQYRKSDVEKERDRISEFTRLNYHPVLPVVYNLQPDKLFLEYFRVAVEGNSAEEIVKRIAVDDSIAGVYKFNIMKRETCRTISLEIEAFNEWCKENGCRTDPPSLYDNSVVLNYFGLQNVIDKLVKYLEPVIKAYYGCDAEIDSQFSFSVTFGLEDGKQRRIDPNYDDDSDITIKLCLSDLDSSGSQLMLGEIRCMEHETMQVEPPPKEMKVEMGQVVLHSGRHRNGFTPIEEYSKEYLIIWCKSYVFREMTRLNRPKLCIICERLRKEKLESLKSQVDNAIAAVDGKRVRPGGSPGSPSGESRKKQKM